MFHVFMEMPSGAVSKPRDFDSEESALKHFEQIAAQLKAHGMIGAAAIITESGEYKTTKEVARETVT